MEEVEHEADHRSSVLIDYISFSASFRCEFRPENPQWKRCICRKSRYLDLLLGRMTPDLARVGP